MSSPEIDNFSYECKEDQLRFTLESLLVMYGQQIDDSTERVDLMHRQEYLRNASGQYLRIEKSISSHDEEDIIYRLSYIDRPTLRMPVEAIFNTTILYNHGNFFYRPNLTYDPRRSFQHSDYSIIDDDKIDETLNLISYMDPIPYVPSSSEMRYKNMAKVGKWVLEKSRKYFGNVRSF